MTDISFPGGYFLNRALMYPAKYSETRVAVDISTHISRISLTESMKSDTIRGTIRMIERSGLLEGYPIRGEEMLYLSLTDAMGHTRDFHFFLYRVDNVDITQNNDGMEYVLHFVSYQRFLADQKIVISSFNDTVSNITQNIFNTYMRESSSRAATGDDPNKQIIIEDTEGLIKIIVPRMTPPQALKFLESRAYSSISPSCSFRFFENVDSYFFATDEYMYKRAQENGIFEFTFAPHLPMDNGSFLQRMANLSKLRNTTRFDTFDDLHSGAYRNKVIVLDIINRTTNMADPGYDHTQAKHGYFKGDTGELAGADRHSDSFIASTFNDENSRKFIMVRDYVEDTTGQLRGEQFIPEIASNRLSYFKNLESITVTASGPGRLDITCGDFVKVHVPSFRAASENPQDNPQLAGVYMVETVTRSIVNEVYMNEYTLVKRNWTDTVDTTTNNYLLGGTIV